MSTRFTSAAHTCALRDGGPLPLGCPSASCAVVPELAPLPDPGQTALTAPCARTGCCGRDESQTTLDMSPLHLLPLFFAPAVDSDRSCSTLSPHVPCPPGILLANPDTAHGAPRCPGCRTVLVPSQLPAGCVLRRGVPEGEISIPRCATRPRVSPAHTHPPAPPRLAQAVRVRNSARGRGQLFPSHPVPSPAAAAAAGVPCLPSRPRPPRCTLCLCCVQFSPRVYPRNPPRSLGPGDDGIEPGGLGVPQTLLQPAARRCGRGRRCWQRRRLARQATLRRRFPRQGRHRHRRPHRSSRSLASTSGG